MFTSLVRRVIEAVKEPRVAFVTEPTALLATRARRPMQEVPFDKWVDLEHRLGDRAMAAALVPVAKGKSVAYVLVGGTSELVAVMLEGDQRLKFLDTFLDQQDRGPRSLTGADLVAVRWNPPPPPPPPWYPPYDLSARLEANLKILSLPVVAGEFSPQVEFHGTING
ncbi:MAG: hypothetical protein R3B06_05095 [Kofleriaceae bacterium]